MLDPMEIAARVLRPRPARKEEALRLVEGAQSVEEAAKRLVAGGFDPSATLAPWPPALVAPEMIPCPACDGRGSVGAYSYDATMCPECKGSGASGRRPPYVPSVRGMALLAADQEGRVAAERAALEAARRLRAWGVPKVDRVVWRVEPRLTSNLQDLYSSGELNWFLLRFAQVKALESGARADEVVAKARIESHVAYAFRYHLQMYFWWTEAAQRGLSFPKRSEKFDFGPAGKSRIDVPDGMAGTPIASVPNPLEPLLELWTTGYAPRGFDQGVAMLQSVDVA